MKNYTIRLNVEKIGPIEIDVNEDTYKRFTRFCKEQYPDKDWQTSSE